MAGSNIGKYVVYAGLGAGGIVAAYFALSSALVNPVNTYSDLYKQQYDNLLKKMANYNSTNPGGWTASQQANVNTENVLLGQTSAGLAQASKGIVDIERYAITVAGAVAISGIALYECFKYVPSFLGKLKSLRGAQPVSAINTSYAGLTCVAQGAADEGAPVEAANVVAVGNQIWATYDLPYMQTYSAQLMEVIPTLEGTDLIVAETLLEGVTMDIETIPVFLEEVAVTF